MRIENIIERYLISESFKAEFITDFGKNTDLTITDMTTGKVTGKLSRYAVWGNLGRGKPEVKEVSDDLNVLKNKYGKDLRVMKIGK